MADISKIQIGSTNYDIKDLNARNALDGKQKTIYSQASEPSGAVDGDLWIDTDAAVTYVELDSTPTSGSTHGVTSGGVYSAISATKSTITSTTLAASSWSGSDAPYTYTLSVSGITATNTIEMLPALNITAEQLEVLQGANIQDGGQTTGSVTLKAFGDKPSIDIPIRIIVRGDM